MDPGLPEKRSDSFVISLKYVCIALACRNFAHRSSNGAGGVYVENFDVATKVLTNVPSWFCSRDVFELALETQRVWQLVLLGSKEQLSPAFIHLFRGGVV